MNNNVSDVLHLGDRTFSSRLLLGTGKFPSIQSLKDSILSSETEIVTVALRRVDLESNSDDLMNVIQSLKKLILPNTSGARNADEAVRLAKLARSALGHGFVKLEVTPEPRYLMPDPIETFKAAEILCKEGFFVMPYIHADPVLAKRLEEVGCITVMPLGAPIGSNKGLLTKEFIRIIIEQSEVPVVVDAGIGSPSHAAQAMELGADAVLVNTAISIAKNPGEIAHSFKETVIAGRRTYLSGSAMPSAEARASSPLTHFLH